MAVIKNSKDLYRFVPTGFTTLDIMFGENIRDPKTFELTSINRGFELGTQGLIAGEQGTGKSTLALDAATFAINMGFPCHKVIVIDADGTVYKENRIRNLSSIENPEEKISVYSPLDVVEDMWDVLVKEDEEYKSHNYKPVEFFNPLINRKVKMMPYTVVIIDTVTSLRASLYSGDKTIKGAKDIFANEGSLQDNKQMARLCKSLSGLFDGNVAYIWVAHLKPNVSIDGTPPSRDFKSAPIDKKISAPKVLKQKVSWALVLYKTIDTTDREKHAQKENVITRLNLETSLAPFSVLARFWKSRTGTEAQTITELPNVATKFDRLYNLIIDCDNLGVFKKGTGMYPSADNPHIFKDKDEASSKIMSSFKREARVMDGYDRPFNLMEARVLMDYNGSNEELINRKIKFLSCCMQNLENRLSYELEVNNKTSEELEENVDKLKNLFNLLGKIERVDVLDPNKVNMESTASMVDADIANEGNNSNYTIESSNGGDDDFDE
jgi:hypothetical protein|nr:MAG TPA: AAA domain protein [Caudoviricetes sp.]